MDTLKTRNGAIGLIPLDQDREGFRMLIGAWLYKGPEGSFVVDPGPSSTIPRLAGEMRRRGVTELDWVLLTHIHLDHAGGTGDLIREFPDASVAVHPRGAKHIMDPEQLNKASRAVLGDLMDTYKDMLPVPKDRIVSADRLEFGPGISVIATPGHAPHHQSFVFEDHLFCGEMLGVHVPMETGLYMRPTTPPKFYLEDLLASFKLLEGHQGPVCLGHYGSLPAMNGYLEKSRQQHILWAEVLKPFAATEHPGYGEMLEALLQRDEHLSAYAKLPDDIKKREEHMIMTSMDGYLGYLRGN